MADDQKVEAVAVSPNKKAPPGKIGDPGEPTVAEWDAEIEADLRVAYAKIQLSPRSKYIRLGRLIMAHMA